MATLPGDVIEDILYKLPLSTILSARAVCKSWKARLGSSDFRKLYDLNCTRENNKWLSTPVLSIYNTSLDRWFQVPITWSRGWDVCAGAGGLLVLQQAERFAVGNPIRNDWKVLPPLPLPSNHLIDKCLSMVKDADANSYKVVVLVHIPLAPIVYDSEVGLWSVKERKDILLTRIKPSAVPDGVIYGVNSMGSHAFKYNVENDELTCVSQNMPWRMANRLAPWIVAWKGNIYSFHRDCSLLDVFVLTGSDKWVLLSRCPWGPLGYVTLWLEGEIVKLFVRGKCLLVTYNLAVAHSWNKIETGSCPPLEVYSHKVHLA